MMRSPVAAAAFLLAATVCAPTQAAVDWTTVGEALGKTGTEQPDGVYQVYMPRADAIEEGGMKVPDSMGTAIAINFQPTGAGKAAITADFVLTAEEVNPVLRTLREHGIEMTALHNHLLNDQPRLFFSHFWANDDAEKLAQGLRAALDKVNIAKS